MDHRELAAELFLSDSNCAQAVLEAFSDVTGLKRASRRSWRPPSAAAWGGCRRSAVRSAGC